ncbi:MAG TPA: peptidylprolyl isomerase [Anaeromyxobacteraceae bacterium]|nr:peptidylprolyl isomerase [Anaeromyxobacteraceae bacterium]
MTRPLVIAAAALLANAALAQPAPAGAKPKEQYAVFVTSAGTIGVKLDPAQAPNAVKNFVELAEGKKAWKNPATGADEKKPLYDGTLFHRVIPRFMIQGGDPLTRGAAVGETRTKDGRPFGMGGPGFELADELQAGTHPFAMPCQLAMANHGPNTNGSQFFITEVPTPHLDPRSCETGICGYVHLGEGVCGCDLVQKIAAAGNSRTRLEKVVITGKAPTCK